MKRKECFSVFKVLQFSLLTLLLLGFLLTSGFSPIQGASEGQIIDVGNYSVELPPGEDWEVEVEKAKGVVRFIKKKQSLLGALEGIIDSVTIIQVSRIRLTSKRWHLSEEEAADGYRNYEEKGMIDMGVNQGEYTLEDVKKGVTKLGEKKLYFMSYKQNAIKARPNMRDEAVLYLYFPPDFKKNHTFFIFNFLISETYTKGSSVKADLTQIYPVIKNFKIISSFSPTSLVDFDAFKFDRRLYIYEKIDEIANQLQKSTILTILKSKEIKDFDTAIIFKLMDRDGDGKADEFVFSPEKVENTQDFGFIFDLNNNGKIDYIVFNGGPQFTKDFKKMIWMNYHWIDSNYDGKIDIMVFNDIDLDGDKFPDEGITAWTYDLDFNGTIDKAEYLEKGFEKSIQKTDGVFIIKRSIGEKKIPESEKDSFTGLNTMLSEINSMLLP